MPHCQKENHDRKGKSKKERQEKKEAALARKKAFKTVEEEEEEKLKLSNNISLAEGFGDYEVGCDAEREYVAKFNMNKRSKKHLRLDIRRQQERKEREEEERRKSEQEEKYRLEQEKLKHDAANEEEEEEEEPLTEEYLVYICLCCHKKFLTANQFKNHTDSKRHRDNAILYEEAGVIVTEVQLGKDFDDDEFSSDDDRQEFELSEEECGEENSDDSDDEEVSDGEEEDYEPRKVGLFSAFAAHGDSSSSDSDSDSDSHDDEDEEKKVEIEAKTVDLSEDLDENDFESEYVDDLDLLEEIIYQNRLNERLYPGDETNKDDKSIDIAPVPFDDEQYDPDNLNTDENRLAAVQHRLQKRLAAKGIQPNQINSCYKTPDAVSIGKTLLQQVMAANIETLEAKLAEYNRHKEEFQLLGRDFRFAKGNSKALASQYSFRIDPADNQRKRENVHHAGSHYHMQAARSMQFGRTKGLMARHSNQGSRLQASRMAAKEMQQIHGKGMKVGKTSKKSQQKRRGEAGGSKKTGGTNTSEN